MTLACIELIEARALRLMFLSGSGVGRAIP
jgi:hypothetical protein